MKILECNVSLQNITLNILHDIISDTQNIYEVSFVFDDEWSGMQKTIIFKNGDKIAFAVLDETSIVKIPSSVMIAGNLFIGVQGNKEGMVLTTKKHGSVLIHESGGIVKEIEDVFDENEFNKLMDKLANVDVKLDSVVDELNVLFNNKITAVEELFNNKILEVNTSAEELNNTFNSNITNLKNEFNTATTNQKKEFENVIAENKSTFDSTIQENQTMFENATKAQKTQFDTSVNEVKQVAEKVEADKTEVAQAKTDVLQTREELQILLAPGAGAHNAIYHEKNLGTQVTDEQWNAIKNGTFEGMFIGSYWNINNVVWRIANFDYYYNTGDPICMKHHVTIVPDEQLYTHCMNDTNTTEGAYAGSKMRKEGLEKAKELINSAFGEDHILNHRQYLQNKTNGNYTNFGGWYDSTVELMTEKNVYGCEIYDNCINGTLFPVKYTIDKTQYMLFRYRPDLISNRQWFWLRDVVSSNTFADVGSYGTVNCYMASSVHGVRPAFSIC